MVEKVDDQTESIYEEIGKFVVSFWPVINGMNVCVYVLIEKGLTIVVLTLYMGLNNKRCHKSPVKRCIQMFKPLYEYLSLKLNVCTKELMLNFYGDALEIMMHSHIWTLCTKNLIANSFTTGIVVMTCLKCQKIVKPLTHLFALQIFWCVLVPTFMSPHCFRDSGIPQCFIVFIDVHKVFL